MGAREIRVEIDEMVDAGASLREIEHEVIEQAPLSEDARAALWLYTWGSLERRSQRPAVFA